ncbi:tRNA lysidine(34) synthetase TilS [Aeoliella sp. ICT_H6.2]|uniref:tRNA(Ile)-lysidine synthase n=1 Tax=Aeoliella straminimaris TaxID=2954799 RepID=A0A9X2F7Y1_9BACT|nr:tRNA lysidine(34) synthetase TilS [Aeoliella straminimaris]MCO6043524.1 tRNA lysidine(34) synthetase TilS [Aeoliella straminimaris]
MLTSAIENAWPSSTWRACHVVVAVSGGADSVAMLRALVRIHQQTRGKGQLTVAHFNHRTRAAASDDDAQWVAELARKLNLDAVVDQARAAGSLIAEEQARRARYEFLRSVAEQRGARFITTAHTQDDQVETVLMRALRGSGIDGLTGIPVVRPLGPAVTLVRPLLSISRAEVESYLERLGQDYRHDASNLQSHYTRNWVRRDLLPQIRDRLPGDPDAALLRLSEQASQWRDAIEQIAVRLAARAVQYGAGQPAPTVRIDTPQLADEPAIVIQQVARTAWRQAGWGEQAMGMTEWQRLAAAVVDDSASTFVLPGSISVRRQGTDLVLERS